jgi:PAS domain-containing protein
MVLHGESIEFESESIRLGRRYRVSAYPSEPGRFVTVFEDVTERIAAESRLRESERKYRALFEQSSEAISVVSVDGTVLDANDAWLSLFHCLREDVPGLNIGVLCRTGRARGIPQGDGAGWCGERRGVVSAKGRLSLLV